MHYLNNIDDALLDLKETTTSSSFIFLKEKYFVIELSIV